MPWVLRGSLIIAARQLDHAVQGQGYRQAEVRNSVTDKPTPLRREQLQRAQFFLVSEVMATDSY